MSAEYVRSYYRIPIYVGDRIYYDGGLATVIAFKDQYLRVRTEGDMGRVITIHPTWRVRMVEHRKTTRVIDGERRIVCAASGATWPCQASADAR